MRLSELIKWLKTESHDELAYLWQWADKVRAKSVGDQVHCRGLIELSNYCWRSCTYCGLRQQRKKLSRYRMNMEEVRVCVRQAIDYGYGTVVLQSGEDNAFLHQQITSMIKMIKAESDLAITLSLGEQSFEHYRQWFEAGAERYLLRIETTDRDLLNRIHPGEPFGSRISHLEQLKSIGYEVGSGVMVGLPGQTYKMLAKDIEWFKKFDLDMIGVGPYLPHPDTPLGKEYNGFGNSEQVPNTEQLTNIVVALTRIMCPTANIPATSALATINQQNGREQALTHGANVVMPNLTPAAYRACYEIYPNKACIRDEPATCHVCMKKRIIAAGRKIGKGKGSRIGKNIR